MADYTNWLPRCAYRSVCEPVLYQGVGPGQTALIFYGQAGLSQDFLRDCFACHGGRYGEPVTWRFQERGQILVSKWQSHVDETTLLLESLGAGADEVRFDDSDLMEVITQPYRLQRVLEVLELEEIPILQANLVWRPRDLMTVYEDTILTQLLGLLDTLTAKEEICNLTADFWIVDEKLEHFV